MSFFRIASVTLSVYPIFMGFSSKACNVPPNSMSRCTQGGPSLTEIAPPLLPRRDGQQIEKAIHNVLPELLHPQR